MIAKIPSTANLGRVLDYNFKKVRWEEVTILLADGLYQNQNDGYAMEQVLSDMQQLIPNGCGTEDIVLHCPLNSHPDEKLPDEQLAQITKKYMEELGCGNQPYIIFKHSDATREHIHIVSFHINGDNEKVNDGFERRGSKKITNALGRKYSSIPSSLKKENNGQIYDKVDTDEGDIKQQVSSIIHAILEHHTLCPLSELNAILSRYNLVVEEVEAECKSRRYGRLVYVPADDKGNRVSIPIRVSDIGRGVGYTAVQNKILKSKQSIKAYIPWIRKKALEVIRTSPITKAELLDNLNKWCLRIVIRRNEGECIYGITLIDNEKDIALNGSGLGKGYTANLFNACLSDPAHDSSLNESPYSKTSITLQQ